ncbi:MAG: hypothetical protein K0M56_06980 [Kaistella sp.]|nr:hypothetical protein [Kaistella sp.]
MMKPLYLKGCYFLIFLLSCSFHGQKKEIFNFDMPELKVEASKYSKIRVIDVREDTTSVGAFQGKPHVLEIPLGIQFQKIVDGLNPDHAEKGELVLYVKRLAFAGGDSGNYIHFQGYLFSRNSNGKYSPIDKADEIVKQSVFSSKKENYRRINETISGFLEKNLNRTPKIIYSYSFEDLQNFIHVDKQQYPLYKDELKDGIYENYYRFKTQYPSEIISDVKFAANPDKIYKVYYLKEGKKESVDIKKTFAIVYKGQPYILVPDDNNYSKATKREEEFYFIGNVNGKNQTFYMFYGLTGVLIGAIFDPTTKYEFTLDYFNGNSVPVRKIKRY